MCAGPAVQAQTSKARIAVVGDADAVSVGQRGYCGAMTNVEEKAWRGIFVDGGERTWMRLKASVRAPVATVTCEAEFSFVPLAGNAYIIRYTVLQNTCKSELFRVVPGADPVREDLTQEDRKSCLAKPGA